MNDPIPNPAPLAVSEEDARHIEALLDQMSFEELAGQLAGRGGLHALTPWTYRLGAYRSGGLARAGIAPLAFTDGPRGLNLGRSTAFPSASSRGASWDEALEERVGLALGAEARAQGATAVGSTCVNLVRHPGWGRAQESFGSDPHHVGQMGAAHTRGLRRAQVLPVLKHFALNSIEDSRFKVDVRIDDATLREIYLPQFLRAIQAGAGAVMTSYNKVNGTRCGEHAGLMAILREEWGFEGFTTSDFFLGLRHAARSMRAGLDQEMPQAWHYSALNLRRLERRGDLQVARVREAAGRVLRARAACGVLWPSPRPSVDLEAHHALALKVAIDSIVVARAQDQALPIPEGDRLGLIGPLAARAHLGSEGSVSVSPPYAISPLQGLRERFKRVLYEPRSSRRAIARLARRVDRLIAFIGAGSRDEGEYFPLLGGGDRVDVSIPKAQARAVREALATGRPTIVVWVGGGLPTLGPWQREVRGLILAGHGGMFGGRALAEVLSGSAVPGGHLTSCVASSPSQLVAFDPAAVSVRYDRFFDYRRHDQDATQPLFWIGHGSAQTRLEARARGATAELARRGELALGRDDLIALQIEVFNRGAVAAAPLVTLFVGRAEGDLERAPRALRAFDKVRVGPGESALARLEVPVWALRQWCVASRSWRLEPGRRALSYSLAGGSAQPLGEVIVRV